MPTSAGNGESVRCHDPERAWTFSNWNCNQRTVRSMANMTFAIPILRETAARPELTSGAYLEY